MDKHALTVLEYDKIKTLLKGYTASDLGREAVEELQPLNTLETIQYELSDVTEMVRLHTGNQAPPLDGIYDVRPSLQQSVVPGAVLDAAELILIGETATAARRVKSALKRSALKIPGIKRYGDRLALQTEIESALERVFDDQHQVRDRASRALATIRKSIRNRRTSLVRQIEKMMRKTWSAYLQESYHTQRDGRFVLPIDAKYQNKVKGIIHDRSSTGTTVFIEPLELVEEGNLFKQVQREEEIEIRKILQELTGIIAKQHDELQNNLHILKHLDFISAKARFSIACGMNEPALSQTPGMTIVEGYHPLLLVKHGRENVVPFDVAMDEGTNGVIVTGPNTGGKTVLLKAVGLLVLMVQSGLHVPVKAGTVFGIFEDIGADIGDEQSLEQSLSTFSSHISHIKAVLEKARSGMLVLLDEFGSGTDPVEGGALSCAILSQIHRQGAMFFVTTHLHDLKEFAYQYDGVENGAMEFDLEALQPTYRFTMGLPGKSNAIQIALRLGLPMSVIEDAKSQVQTRGDSPEDLLLKLGDELQQAQVQREKADEIRFKAENLKQEVEQRLNKAKREATDIITRSQTKANNYVHELEGRLHQWEKKEQTLKREWQEKLTQLREREERLQQPASATNEMRQQVKAAKRSLEASKPKIERESKMEPRLDWTWKQLKPGARVRIQEIPGFGEVVRVWPKKHELEVSINSLTLQIGSDKIISVLAPKKPSESKKLMAGVYVDRPHSVDHEIDIHGMTVDEMMPLVQKFIDQAFLAGLASATIVHGHGFGVLRRTVRSMLKNNPMVRNCRPGLDVEGGSGVTVVTLNQSR